MKRKTHKDIIDGWHSFTEEEINRYVSKGYWHNLTTGDLLDRNAEGFPDKRAFIDDKCELTWGEVKQRADSPRPGRQPLPMHGIRQDRGGCKRRRATATLKTRGAFP